ncbi:hypothetical protein FHT70_005559 [Rhizobium sp. BK049]|uniref:hypothetical protein n=1 Tax=Rhizobium sp. BK049 TaxID=2587095 RepID=UPI0016085164|nr:hypothetical protein [Rhizobium sp. BK049]MBB3355596.1 hypothetical protein [Rhizobium sp. BK049]
MIVDGDEDAEPHLTAEEVQTLLGFVQRFNPVIVGGQAVNIWAELYHGMDEELDGLGELTSKDLDFYHNREAERALANSLEDGLLEIPSGDNHTPNAAVVKGKLGNREIVVDFLAQIKGVEGKSLLENSITFADAENPEGISVTLMHPLDCVRSRLSNINMLGRRSDHSLRQAVASLLILECYIEDQLSDLENKPAVKRALTALRELEFIVRELHIGKTTEREFGDQLRPVSILQKYREDERLDVRVREHQLQGILERLEAKQNVAGRRRKRIMNVSDDSDTEPEQPAPRWS